MHAILHDEPPEINATSPVAAELAAVARRLLRKKPAERYPAAEAVLQALEKEPGWRFQNALELQAPLTRCRVRRRDSAIFTVISACVMSGRAKPVPKSPNTTGFVDYGGGRLQVRLRASELTSYKYTFRAGNDGALTRFRDLKCDCPTSKSSDVSCAPTRRKLWAPPWWTAGLGAPATSRRTVETP